MTKEKKEHKVKVIDLSNEDPESLKDENGNVDFNKIMELANLANPDVETETSFGISQEVIKDKKLNPDSRLDIPFLKKLNEKVKQKKRQEML